MPFNAFGDTIDLEGPHAGALTRTQILELSDKFTVAESTTLGSLGTAYRTASGTWIFSSENESIPQSRVTDLTADIQVQQDFTEAVRDYATFNFYAPLWPNLSRYGRTTGSDTVIYKLAEGGDETIDPTTATTDWAKDSIGTIQGTVLTDTDTITLNTVNTLSTSTAPTVVTEDGTDYDTAGFILPDGINGDYVFLAIEGPNYPRLITSSFSGYTSNTEVFLNTNSSLILLTWRNGIWRDFTSPAQGGGGTGGSGDVTTAQLDSAVAFAQSERDNIKLENLPIRQMYVYDTLANLNAVDRHSSNVYALVVENNLVLESDGVDTWLTSTVTNIVSVAANQQVIFTGNLSFPDAAAYIPPLGGDNIRYVQDDEFILI